MYFQQFGGSFIYLLIYVNDMLIASKDKSLIKKLKSQRSNGFEMRGLSLAKKIRDIQIRRDCMPICITYLKEVSLKVFNRFKIRDCELVSTSLATQFMLSSKSC